MGNVKFVLKEPNSKKDSLIYLLFHYGSSKRFKYSTSKHANKNSWNPRDQRVRFKKGDDVDQINEINDHIDKIEAYIKQIYRDLERDDLIINNDVLKKGLDIKLGKLQAKQTLSKKVTLLEFCKIFADEAKNTISKGYGKNCHSLYIRLKGYMEKYGHVDIEEIDIEFYRKFKAYLCQIDLDPDGEEVQLMSKNTVGKHQKILKRVLEEAYDRGITKNEFFRSKKFTVDREKVSAVYLTVDELEKLHNHKFKRIALEHAIDRFLIGACTGLRYGDFVNLTPANFKENHITKTTSKTGEVVTIPIHWIVKEIRKKYNNKLPGLISNQQLNKHLKDACKEVKLNDEVVLTRTEGNEKKSKVVKKWECIATHTARRSFATNLYLEHIKTGKIGLKTIMSWTGHKSVKQFMEYVHADQLEMLNVLDEIDYFRKT